MAINVESFRSDGIREGTIGDEEDDKRGDDAVSDRLQEFDLVKEEIMVSGSVE